MGSPSRIAELKSSSIIKSKHYCCIFVCCLDTYHIARRYCPLASILDDEMQLVYELFVPRSEIPHQINIRICIAIGE